jgi:hypothetical protein
MIDDQIVILALETYFGFKLEWWPEQNREKMRAAIEAAINASDAAPKVGNYTVYNGPDGEYFGSRTDGGNDE